jgi:hypothetical protein
MAQAVRHIGKQTGALGQRAARRSNRHVAIRRIPNNHGSLRCTRIHCGYRGNYSSVGSNFSEVMEAATLRVSERVFGRGQKLDPSILSESSWASFNS